MSQSVSAELMLRDGQGFVPIGKMFQTGIDLIGSVTVKIGLLKTVEVDVVLNPDLETGLKILRSKRIGLGFSTKVNSVGQSTGSSEIASPTITDINVNMMAVRIGAEGVFSPWYKCFLLQPEVSISDTEISLSLKGIGLMFEKKNEYLTDSVSGKDREQYIRELFGDKVKVIPTQAAKEALAAKPISKTFSASKNKEEVIKELLNECHCVYVQKGASGLGKNDLDTVEIKSVSEIRSGEAKKSFVLYRQFNPNNGVYPIIRFDAPINMLMLPGVGLYGTNFKVVDSATKSTSSTDKAAAYAQDRSTVAASADGTVAGGPPETAKTYPSPSRGVDGSLSDMVSHAAQSMFDQVFTYDVTTIGVFDLNPGDPVDIKVADIDSLSGSFDIYEVEHTVSADQGAETRFKAARTAGYLGRASRGIENAKTTLIEATSGKKVKSSSDAVIKD